jgi:acyl-CoA reductase-like NAD-dependent aldehyde dehydrogenase
MAKELKPKQLEARRKARQLAQGAGKNWKELPQEERKAFLSKARSTPSASPREVTGGAAGERTPNAARDQAKMAAKKAGHTWRDLPKEDRQKYLAQARDDRQKQLAQARRHKT